jgi:NlpC/P60 family putative phage cell wall peptidase
VRGVWRAVVGAEPERAPPYAPGWAEAASGEPLAEAAGRHLIAIERDAFQEGDVLLFRWRANLPAKHAAIVTAADTMVHAHDGAAIAEVTIAPWWRRRLAYAFRFPGVDLA